MAYGKYWTHVAEHPVYIIYNYNGQSMYVEACGIVVLLQRRPNGTPSSVGERLYLHGEVQVVLVSFALRPESSAVPRARRHVRAVGSSFRTT